MPVSRNSGVTAGVVTVGEELLSGETTDTNGAWLGRKLASLGAPVVRRWVVGDDAEAIQWYRLAADQGHASAQGSLGVMYGSGQGVTQDDLEAHIWLNLAAQFSGENREKYVKARDAVAARMTFEQIADAQRRAREWTPTIEP